MKISVRWLNEYLEPANITADSAEEALTAAGFPIEETIELPNGDVMLDVEITSNRGDCISHIGLAREVAAGTGRRLRLPKVSEAAPNGTPGGLGQLGQLVTLDNRVPDVCRLFTLRVVRGVKVGPSPAWLAEALTAVGLRPINNVVDVTNYVLYEFGQPLHAFDLAKLARSAGSPAQVVVRYAQAGEKLALLGGVDVTLQANELVVADGKGAASLAGIMGGRGSEVSATTTDVLLEAATWDPATIRRASRRLQISSDSCHRFERTVNPRTIDLASRRAADLLVKVGGPDAKLVPGVLESGAKPEPATRVSMRASRCREILGFDLPTSEIVRALRAHEIQVTNAPANGTDGPALECVVPFHRPDLDREIDLIEEVARTHGLDEVPILEKLPVRIAAPQVRERAVRELAVALAGMGFYETVTFSFVSPKAAAPFLPKGLETLELCDERRKADPALRPSILPSLLACRRGNQDAGVEAEGGVRLFELASIFAQRPAATPKGKPGSARGEQVETRVLALYADALTSTGSPKGFEARQEAFRLMRGVIESIVRTLGGSGVGVGFAPAEMPFAGIDPAASAVVSLRTGDGKPRMIGTCGLVSAPVLQAYDLATPAVVAELNLAELLGLFPPRSLATLLPQFPGIERDLSFIVPESTAWGAIDALIAGAGVQRLDGWEFVGAYRGAYRDSQNAEHNLAKSGKKAVTVRLRFRDRERTLRHEEVDPQVATLVQLAADRIGAELRS